MTEQQKKFCEEYLVDANAKAAAIRAGYSAKSHSTACDLMANEEIRRYIERRAKRSEKGKNAAGKPPPKKEVKRQIGKLKKEAENEKTAATREVVGFLTSVMRGEVEELKSSAKDRLHAAELLGKRYGIFDDKDGEDKPTIVFSGEGDLE